MAPPSLKLFLSIPVLVSSAADFTDASVDGTVRLLGTSSWSNFLARHPKELLQARRAWNAIREGLDPFGSNVVSKRLQKNVGRSGDVHEATGSTTGAELDVDRYNLQDDGRLQGEAGVESVLLRMENTAAFASPARLAANKLVYSVPLGRWASCATLQLMRSCHKFGWHNGSVVVLVGQESATWCLWAWVSPPTIWRL